jgi:hypothetical protein
VDSSSPHRREVGHPGVGGRRVLRRVVGGRRARRAVRRRAVGGHRVVARRVVGIRVARVAGGPADQVGVAGAHLAAAIPAARLQGLDHQANREGDILAAIPVVVDTRADRADSTPARQAAATPACPAAGVHLSHWAPAGERPAAHRPAVIPVLPAAATRRPVAVIRAGRPAAAGDHPAAVIPVLPAAAIRPAAVIPVLPAAAIRPVVAIRPAVVIPAGRPAAVGGHRAGDQVARAAAVIQVDLPVDGVRLAELRRAVGGRQVGRLVHRAAGAHHQAAHRRAGTLDIQAGLTLRQARRMPAGPAERLPLARFHPATR